jgi:hypothetical protein
MKPVPDSLGSDEMKLEFKALYRKLSLLYSMPV